MESLDYLVNLVSSVGITDKTFKKHLGIGSVVVLGESRYATIYFSNGCANCQNSTGDLYKLDRSQGELIADSAFNVVVTKNNETALIIEKTNKFKMYEVESGNPPRLDFFYAVRK